MEKKQIIKFEHEYSHKRSNPFIRFVVFPLTILTLILFSTGVYAFMQANTLMRREPKQLEDFSSNILPAYSVAYFTSFDSITPLNGWYFPAKSTPISTVVMVHGFGHNRLQFDTETVNIYEYFIENGYNVLSFDLRHSGNSGGNLSAFGYTEWEDVLAAISYVRRIASTTDVILYGFGSGGSACLIAAEKLMEATNSNNPIADSYTALGFDSSYIKAYILDSPLAATEDSIRQLCRKEIFIGKWIGQYTVPYAVRLSAKTEKDYSLTAILGRIQAPVLIFSGETSDPFLSQRSDLLITERARLFPNHTTVLTIPGDSTIPAFLRDQTCYFQTLNSFLKRFVVIHE